MLLPMHGLKPGGEFKLMVSTGMSKKDSFMGSLEMTFLNFATSEERFAMESMFKLIETAWDD